MITLKQTADIIEKLSPDYDVWFEGRGDGTVKLVIEDRKIIIAERRSSQENG